MPLNQEVMANPTNHLRSLDIFFKIIIKRDWGMIGMCTSIVNITNKMRIIV